jgi:uncharacterized repeat protein (TIGR01451 family)
MKRCVLSFAAILLLSFAFAQTDNTTDDNPVAVRLEIYVVSTVDGNEQFKESTTARPGQTVEYRLFALNNGDTTLPAGAVAVTGPVPEGTTYVADSATPTSERVLTEYSSNGTDFEESAAVATVSGQVISAIRWTLEVDMEPGKEEGFVYRVTVNQD